MPPISRRSFLASAAALPFLTWLQQASGTLQARTVQTYVRYDAASPQGQAMLQTYARAVQRMKQLAEGDPTGWTFQWYIHSLPKVKATEITRIYGPSPSPAKALAQASWKTCQPHNAPAVEDYFLPWHRAYVLYFEGIVRAISGDPTFALPYWNYTATGLTHGVIPPQFRDTASALYVSNRNPGVNDGTPIDEGLDPSPINLDALANCYYDTGDGSGDGGFNPDLDAGLHSSVHVLTGNEQNMGSVPRAAGDPVFWVHHCQIDRLWYSWQRAGRTTPAMSYPFTFVNPNGTSATVDLAQFLDYTAQPYTYDSYVNVPACPQQPRPVQLAQQVEEILAARPRRQPVTLGSALTEVTLTPRVPPSGAAGPRTLSARVRALPSERRVYLVLRDLRTNLAPGVLYQVFLELPRTATAQAARQYHVGYINFFDAEQPVGEDAHHRTPTFRFDVTDLARRLGGALDDSVRVTIRPAGRRAPASAARPTIGDIVLTQR